MNSTQPIIDYLEGSTSVDIQWEAEKILREYFVKLKRKKISSTKGKFPSNLTPPKKKRKK